jgi:hypothetical protein
LSYNTSADLDGTWLRKLPDALTSVCSLDSTDPPTWLNGVEQLRAAPLLARAAMGSTLVDRAAASKSRK